MMLPPRTIRKSLAEGVALGAAYRLELPREAMRGKTGGRLGFSAGSSLDFHDYREYHPGDDLRHLDWGVYARSDREVVKMFREEVEPKVDIVLDVSSSMALEDTGKGMAALRLASAIAVASRNASAVPRLYTAGTSLSAVETMAGTSPEGWRLADFGVPCHPWEALASSAPLRLRSLRVLVSDLMWECEPTPVLRRLADGASALFVVQLLAVSEEAPPERGQYRLEDVETGNTADVFVDAEAIEAYKANLAAHRERWSRACLACGAVFAALADADVAVGGRLSALERAGLLSGV